MIQAVFLSGLAGWMLAVLLARSPTDAVVSLHRRLDRILTGELHEQAELDSGDPELDAVAKNIAAMARKLNDAQSHSTPRIEEDENIIDDLADAVIAVDTQGRIVRVNRAAGVFFGQVPHLAMIGRTLLETTLSHPLDELVRACLAEKTPQEGFLEVHSPREMSVSAALIPRTASNGSIFGAIAVLHDITEVRLSERIRQDFVANASHELRTPVTSIQLMAQSLESGALEDPELGPKFVRSISDSSIRLMSLVDDLLYLSVQESDKELTDEVIDASEVAIAACDKLMHQAKAKRVVMACDAPVPCLVRADKMDLWRAIANLVENAIRYSDPGDRVDVLTRVTGDDVEITVKDTGIGIPADQRSKIFERFYRVDPARSRESGGTGLGLSIVRHIVETLGGHIELDSALGLGSAFTIVLPRVVDDSLPVLGGESEVG